MRGIRKIGTNTLRENLTPLKIELRASENKKEGYSINYTPKVNACSLFVRELFGQVDLMFALQKFAPRIRTKDSVNSDSSFLLEFLHGLDGLCAVLGIYS